MSAGARWWCTWAAGTDPVGPPRVGLVVSRSVGPSVVRNQVSRRLRHVARERVAALPDGALLVLRATPAAARASSAELAGDLDSALRRLLGDNLGPARVASATGGPATGRAPG